MSQKPNRHAAEPQLKWWARPHDGQPAFRREHDRSLSQRALQCCARVLDQQGNEAECMAAVQQAKQLSGSQ
jgi:hypothetical protein